VSVTHQGAGPLRNVPANVVSPRRAQRSLAPAAYRTLKLTGDLLICAAFGRALTVFARSLAWGVR
jgi:hypothetical protein